MPYALIPGVAETTRKSRSLRPALIATIAMAIGLIYIVWQKPAATVSADQAMVPSAVTAPSGVPDDHQRDDFALHLAHIRSNVQQATEHIMRTRRLTDTAGHSLEMTSLAVEARRVRAASNAASAAVDSLDKSIEEIDVLSNSLTKEK
jgi:hypothetical protein